MAISTTTRFGIGAAVGVPQVGADFDRFVSDATPRFQVGFKVEDNEGNVYRYGHFGANVDRGVVVAQDISESSLGDSDNVIVASTSSADTSDGLVGSKYLEITAGQSGNAILADQFAGGKFVTTDDAGEGYTYNIVGNTGNATIGSSFRLQLKEKLQVAVTAATDFGIAGSPYANLEGATIGTDNVAAGVSCQQIAIATKPYGWIQTQGIVGILQSGTAVIGQKITLTATAGAVGPAGADATASATLNSSVGSTVITGDSGGHGVFSINLE